MDISRSEQELLGADSTGHEKDGSEDSGENKCYQRSGDGGKNRSLHQRKRFSLTTGWMGEGEDI